MLDKGKDPAEIVDTVFDAINNDAFYILHHPAWNNIVKGHVEQILARGAVATTDMADLLRHGHGRPPATQRCRREVLKRVISSCFRLPARSRLCCMRTAGLSAQPEGD
jgi:hypothetical protein